VARWHLSRRVLRIPPKRCGREPKKQKVAQGRAWSVKPDVLIATPDLSTLQRLRRRDQRGRQLAGLGRGDIVDGVTKPDAH
jgi:predicted ABC-type transport system involved in lysophospholipase L1 biosynthesis ATPase subunit